jgi:cytochrome c556
MHVINLKRSAYTILLSFIISLPITAEELEDNRILITLPKDVQKQFLLNMRDHMAALDDILHAVQASEFDKAKTIASSRLIWNSFIYDKDNNIAKHLPVTMRKMAEKMDDDVGKFIWLAQNASIQKTPENYQYLFEALGNITSTCRSCHETYRVR